MSTDLPCSSVSGTSVTVGRLGDIDTRPPSTSSTFCEPSGDLGVLVVVPSGSLDDEVALRVVAATGRDPASCVPPYGKGCIVARRALRFVPHAGLRVSVPLRKACDGLPCGPTTTCVAGACTEALIAESARCTGGCDEAALAPAPPSTPPSTPLDTPPPATADAAPDGPAPPDASVPATYNDMTSAPNWLPYNSGVRNLTVETKGAVFDGTYVYFAPYQANVITNGLAVRYDTRATFDADASWIGFDLTTVTANASGFAGAAYDGRYLYFAPNYSSNPFVARYDTQAPFAAAGSWTMFNVKAANAGASGFLGAVFDGRYLYLVPNQGAATGLVARYDTQATFGTAASWSFFAIATVNASARAFAGATYDGRYLYFTPYYTGTTTAVAARYDTQAPFAATASWSTFDVATVDTGTAGYNGAVFDGRYVYFPPNDVSKAVARHDTQAPFATSASWSAFAVPTLNPNGYTGAAFDGRFVYFVPSTPPTGTMGAILSRYDTQAPFAAASSWSSFDTTSFTPYAHGSGPAAFDGRFLYVPGPTTLRFDAKKPSTPGGASSFF